MLIAVGPGKETGNQTTTMVIEILWIALTVSNKNYC
jgi:hypothetical protein